MELCRRYWRRRPQPAWAVIPAKSTTKLTREFGAPAYDRVEAPATPGHKELLAKLSPQQVKLTQLAGERIQTIVTRAPGKDAPLGGLKVIAESGWFAAHPGGSPGNRQRYSGDAAVPSSEAGKRSCGILA
jgi:phosphoglucomutase